MEVIPYEYYIDDSLDWLRVVRRKKEAKNGEHIAKSRRKYLKSEWVIAILPLSIKLYKDSEGRLFVDEKDIVEWDDYEKYARMFE